MNGKQIGLFLLPALAWSASLTSVELKTHDNRVDVSIEGKPFTTYYVLPDVAKPYMMPLRTASGVVVTRGFPVENDASAGNPKASSFEPHQRPLYWGHGNVDGLDFWQEPVFDHYYTDHQNQAYGHAKLLNMKAEGDSITADFSLRDPSEREIARERQSFHFGGADQTRIVDCEFTITATAGPVVFGDTKEGSFGIRLAQDLSGARANMTNSQGAHGEKEIWGKPAEWVSYQGEVGGRPATVSVFDHPSSFRHPTTWHARAYGLFAANPFGWREFSRDPNKDGSWTVGAGEKITFRYRVLIADGKQSSQELVKAYSEYAATK
jgi:Methane oxygenase PmoA